MGACMANDHVFYTNASIDGDHIYLRYVKNGERKARHFPYRPKLYVPADETDTAERHTIYGEPVKALEPRSITETRQFIKSHEGIPGFELYNSDVPFTSQFINDLFGDEEITPDNNHLRIFFLDAETTAEQGFPDVFDPQEEFNVISIYDSYADEYHVWTTLDASADALQSDEAKALKDKIVWHSCTSETELLTSFLSYWKANVPDILTGWNTKLFDMPYLVARVWQLFGESAYKKLSPVGKVRLREVNIMGKQQRKVEIQGVSQLDYLDLYRKYTFKQRDNYKLDNIARIELSSRKLELEGDTFRETYLGDQQQLFVEYNIVDTDLVRQLDEKLGLLHLVQTLAYMARVNYEEALGPVKLWDQTIFKYLHQNGMVAPLQQSHEKDELEGAYVKTPEPGFKGWVASFDVASLYPSVIMGYNMSPETIIPYTPPSAQDVNFERIKNGEATLEGENFTMAANNSCFSTTQEGILPKLTRKLFALRKQEKKAAKEAKENGDPNTAKLHDTLQMAYKVTLNSLYGACGNVHFRYYAYPIASGITATGRNITMFAENTVREFLKSSGLEDDVIYCDTDSIYVQVNDFIEKMKLGDAPIETKRKKVDAFCEKKISPVLAEAFDGLAKRTNNPQNDIVMEREIIADSSLWITKKRYLARVIDDEGMVVIDDPKMKIMGIEAVRSSTPEFCRDKIVSAVRLILDQDHTKLMNFIDAVEKEFMQLPVEDISYPRSVSDVDKFMEHSGTGNLYKKGSPIHAKSAILYNHLLEKHGLAHKYQWIQNGDRIKFVQLSLPNPLRESVIGFNSVLPPEFGLHDSVDYHAQFEGAFKKPIENIVKHVGWQIDGQQSLEDFFG